MIDYIRLQDALGIAWNHQGDFGRSESFATPDETAACLYCVIACNVLGIAWNKPGDVDKGESFAQNDEMAVCVEWLIKLLEWWKRKIFDIFLQK